MPEADHKSWFAVEITALPEASEALEFALNSLDSLGTEIDGLSKRETENIVVIGYFEEDPPLEKVKNEINAALEIYGLEKNCVDKISRKSIKDRDWLAEWKKYWKPIETSKFIIAPTWAQLENAQKFVIRIEPCMAFGTGTHETTLLCLKAIEKHYRAEMSFLDVGTGTGILAIAAAKIQDTSKKRKILACDTDKDAIKIARKNAALNNSGRIEFIASSISENLPKFDFVCANITADVIMPMLPLLIDKSLKIVVLSGILTEQGKEVLRKLEKLGVSDPKIETDGEWISITFFQN